MTKSLRKDFRREIKKSFSRFISILLIVTLGVAFYSGIRSSMPVMQMTADSIYDKENLMDIRVVGTLGLTENDLKAINEIQGVEFAEGAYTTDFLCLVNSKELVTKVIATPEKLNDVRVSEGRYPEKFNECVVSKEFLDASGLSIGEFVTLKTGTDKSIFDTLAAETYEIVGVGSSSYFLNGDMGTATIGDGTVDGYVVISQEAYVTNVYTSIYVQVEGAKKLDCYGEEYTKLIETMMNKIKAISDRRCDIRYSEVRSTSNELLEKARTDFEAAEITVQTELAEAYQKILEGRQLYEEQKLWVEQNAEILNNAATNLPIYEKELATAKAELEKAEKSVTATLAALEKAKAELEVAKAQLEEIKNNPEATEQDIKDVETVYKLTESAVAAYQATMITEQQKLEEGKKEYESKKTEVEALRAAVESGQLASAQQQLVKAEEELKRAEEQYEISKQDATDELADAEVKLETAEREITNMEVPVWYVLNRDSVESYLSYKNDAQSIGAIGTVFPIIFFLVAALVSLTTMTRMVEEQRTQIGTLKALGYSKFSIVSKYLRYATLASVIGSVIGVFAGEYTIPSLMVWAYKLVYYNLGNAVITLNAEHGVTAAVIAIFCTTFAAFAACYKELKSVPAQLMRPEAPRAGKRTLIERISFIWDRLNFGQKSAMRNLFRYKKRFLMTLFGVGGCMALLLVGFGVRDSVSAMADKQYGEVFNYSGIVSVDTTLTRAQRRTLLSNISDISDITEYTQATRTMVYGTGESAKNLQNEKNAYLVVPRDVDGFPSYVRLQERAGLITPLTDEGVIITEKYADLLGVSVGDSIFIRLGEADAYSKEVKVTGITENYIFNYIYMTPNLYQSIYGSAAEINILMFKTANNANTEDISTRLLSINGVNSVTMNEDELGELNTVINNLYFIVIVMIIAAAILAFVVIYNLNNINISERRRELATLKLLGFYNGELAQYVYRENVILTLLGTLLGVGLGIVLHQFVMVTVETDVYMFGRELEPLSIVIAAVLTIIFAMIVNSIMYFKLKKVNMIESLKSVE